MANLSSLPPELLRSILLDVDPKDLISLASVNRHLRKAVFASVDYALASHHLAPIQWAAWCFHIPFNHPLLFEHTVAAVSQFRIDSRSADSIWGRKWKLFKVDAEGFREETMLQRVRVLRTAVQRRLWPTTEASAVEGRAFDPSQHTEDMQGLAYAAEMAGFLRSLDLLADLRNAFPDAFAAVFPDPIPIDMKTTNVLERFLFASAESGFCGGLNLIPQGHPILMNNVTNFDSVTLLGLASTSRCIPAVELLLAKGALVNTTISWNPQPLFCAVGDDNLEVMRLLLQHGANVHHSHRDGTVMHKAANTGNPKALKLVLEHGANPEARDGWGRTPLFIAANAFERKLESTRILLDAGVDVNAVDKNGETPLFWACLGVDVEVVRELIDRGANVNHVSFDRSSPLHSAVSGIKRDKAAVVKVLLEAGAKIDAQDRDGVTPLHLACKHQIDEELLAIATVLLEAGADPNIETMCGLTPLGLFPLEVAVKISWSRSEEEVFELFIAKGADLEAEVDGATIWELLCACRHQNPRQWEELREKFIAKGADLQAKTKSGVTVSERLRAGGQKNPGSAERVTAVLMCMLSTRTRNDRLCIGHAVLRRQIGWNIFVSTEATISTTW
ncbi:hypothetical protein HDU96_008346 [Phlyctochytrium bullatum]|nr:hypothetical protein HDU96_008346 [Phlyctochytrium bullatum]